MTPPQDMDEAPAIHYCEYNAVAMLFVKNIKSPEGEGFRPRIGK